MKLELRRWEDSDASDLQCNANNPAISINMNEAFPLPYTLEDAAAFIRRSRQPGPDGAIQEFAISLDGKAIGSISYQLHLDRRPLRAEIGYWLGQSYWNLGIGTWAIRSLCKDIFRRYPVESIDAEVFPDNLASRRVLENCGFLPQKLVEKAIYKNGDYLDIYTYSLPRPESSVRWAGV